MRSILIFSYAFSGWAIFLLLFLYWLGFLTNFAVPKSVDSGVVLPWEIAILINILLVLLFGLQHSLMARPWFKKWLTKSVPEPLERSTYVHFSNLALALLFVLWQPIPIVIWDTQNLLLRGVLYGICLLGGFTVVLTSFLINHFDLFGLRQAWLYLRGKPYKNLRFTKPGPYKWVRHPLYVGWLLTMWATPNMTVGHLFFAAAFTSYI
ncbi:MAG: hypothetical protein DCC75_07325, partial [Proteobacteria bacterium]